MWLGGSASQCLCFLVVRGGIVLGRYRFDRHTGPLDTDEDGRTDFEEINGDGGIFTDPTDADSDNDNLNDGDEVGTSSSVL